MSKINFIIIIFSLSLLISASNKESVTASNIEIRNVENPKVNVKLLEIWDHDDTNIENAEYKREVENLKSDFNKEKQSIIDNYNKKIESLRTQRENSMNQLKESFSNKRKALRKRHGIKNKTDQPVKKTKAVKKANNNKDSSDKVSKKRSAVVHPSNKKQPINGKKPIKLNSVPKEDVKEVPKKSKK